MYDAVVSQGTLHFGVDGGPARSVSPYLELGAYEALWSDARATFKSLAELFRANPDALPSDLVPRSDARTLAARVVERIRGAGVRHFGVRVHRAGEYPLKLRDARHPVELLYYRGAWELSETRCIAVVRTRTPSSEAESQAGALAHFLVGEGWTVVSGLAHGVDSIAHRAAIRAGGRTIAVAGTPLTTCYPLENRALQEEIARDFLLISQVPVWRHSQQDYRRNRFFFPERNVTMSALTEATVIVDAGETSGTLIQARAALHQGRKLFILDRCFERADLTWPRRFAEQGAIRVRDFAQIREVLGRAQQD